MGNLLLSARAAIAEARSLYAESQAAAAEGAHIEAQWFLERAHFALALARKYLRGGFRHA